MLYDLVGVVVGHQHLLQMSHTAIEKSVGDLSFHVSSVFPLSTTHAPPTTIPLGLEGQAIQNAFMNLKKKVCTLQ